MRRVFEAFFGNFTKLYNIQRSVSKISGLPVRYFSLPKNPTFSFELNFLTNKILEKIFQTFPILKQNVKNIRYYTDSNFFKKNENPYNKQNNKKELINSPNKNLKKFHQYSPTYNKVLREAEKKFCDINDEKIKKQLISLYLQMKLQ